MANTNPVDLTNDDAAQAALAAMAGATPEETPNEVPQEADPVDPTPATAGSVDLPSPAYPVDTWGFTSNLRKEVRRSIGRIQMSDEKAKLLLSTLQAATEYVEATLAHRKIGQ